MSKVAVLKTSLETVIEDYPEFTHQLGEEAKGHRKILEDYSTEMLDQMISITTGALIISYSLYTFLADNNYMMLTIPFAIYGLFRYLFLVHTRDVGGEPEMLFKDRGMLVCMVLWGVVVVGVLYLDIWFVGGG